MIKGAARFVLDGETFQTSAVSLVAIPDPSVRRSAVAVEDGTLLLAIGASPGSDFASTWKPANFEQVPRAD